MKVADRNNFSKNDYFPREMNNLSNLRYLGSSKRLNFPGIDKLKFLQEVHVFNIKKENGYIIEELEHMHELRVLGIKNLNDVRDATEACNAKLCDKRRLANLSLYWDIERSNADSDLDERVLDNLQPYNYLKTLKITYYMGVRSSIWMNEAHLINNLEEIKLLDCLERLSCLKTYQKLNGLKLNFMGMACAVSFHH